MTITIDGTNGITLPSGSVAVGTTDSQTLTNKTLTSPTITGALTTATSQSASGTAVNFLDIPSWVKRITIMFYGVSLSGTSNPLVQIGAGSVDTSGYLGAGSGGSTTVATTTFTTGFGIRSVLAADLNSGHMVLTNITGYTWIQSHTLSNSGGSYFLGGGNKVLTGSLDRIRITTVNGTDTFDAGSINILYE